MNQGNLALNSAVETPLLQPGQVRLEPWSEARGEWIELVARAPQATVFHGDRWIESILSAYPFRMFVAALRAPSGRLVAAVPLAESVGIMRRKLVALPFSDYCAPLEDEPGAADALMAGLAAMRGLPPIEVRGYDAPAPWHKFDMFERWTVNTTGTAAEIDRRLSHNFRRLVRRAEADGMSVEQVRSSDGLNRFYEMLSTARRQKGLPTQPARFFQAIVDGMGEQAELWFVTLDGRDLAVEFTLTYRDCLYGKWMARTQNAPPGATQILIWKLIAEHPGTYRRFDVGRTDRRNDGLIHFKRQHGAEPSSLPYVFVPQPPGNISSEHVTGMRAMVSRVWPRLPRPVTERLSAFIYRYIS